MGRKAACITVAFTWVVVAVMMSLVGCRSSEELLVQAQATAKSDTTLESNALDSLPLAPAADALRKGAWLGGPDPVSGKLRSGISTYYRLDPAHPKAGQAVQVDLRFEEVLGRDATVKLTVGDGAQWATPIQTSWRLSQGTPSQVTLHITVPAGDSYLHVMTAQNHRPSVASILLAASTDLLLKK